MDGILLIDKPKGWSSFDVIRKLRGSLREQANSSDTKAKIKMGHAGTLDPLATGLLVVLIGKATKQQQDFMKLDKCYEAEVTLGATSTTDDAEGDLSNYQEPDIDPPQKEDLLAVIDKLKGEIEQVPPRHSAIKIDGQRAYKRARNGEEVEMPPRKVKVYGYKDIQYDYPLISFRVEVSSGTYIRSLARDIGEQLGTGGYLSALRRTSIGEFNVDYAISPEADSGDLVSRIITDQ